MQVIKKIINGIDLKDIIEMPNSLINKKVQIIVFPLEENKEKKENKKSLSGFLSKYAKPELINEEENIWLSRTLWVKRDERTAKLSN